MDATCALRWEGANSLPRTGVSVGRAMSENHATGCSRGSPFFMSISNPTARHLFTTARRWRFLCGIKRQSDRFPSPNPSTFRLCPTGSLWVAGKGRITIPNRNLLVLVGSHVDAAPRIRQRRHQNAPNRKDCTGRGESQGKPVFPGAGPCETCETLALAYIACCQKSAGANISVKMKCVARHK
jgi:hypothetical protein